MEGMQVKTKGLSFLQLHGKNGFAEVSQILTRYRSENNLNLIFIKIIKAFAHKNFNHNRKAVYWLITVEH